VAIVSKRRRGEKGDEKTTTTGKERMRSGREGLGYSDRVNRKPEAPRSSRSRNSYINHLSVEKNRGGGGLIKTVGMPNHESHLCWSGGCSKAVNFGMDALKRILIDGLQLNPGANCFKNLGH